MSAQEEVSAALLRAQSVYLKRPQAAVHDDAPATATWQGGLRLQTQHPNGTQLSSDMPAEFGGSGDRITPGWLFRAGLSACAATSIAMTAAIRQVVLARLEVRVDSTSDSRGLLGVPAPDGQPVFAGPLELRLHVTIEAQGVAAGELRALVDEGLANSPVPSATRRAMDLQVQIDARGTDAG